MKDMGKVCILWLWMIFPCGLLPLNSFCSDAHPVENVLLKIGTRCNPFSFASPAFGNGPTHHYDMARLDAAETNRVYTFSRRLPAGEFGRLCTGRPLS